MKSRGNFSITKERFAIIKSSSAVKEAFANIIDKNEITVIIEQDKVRKEYVIKIEEDFRLITFDMILPFSMTGFISEISTALANEKIPLFFVSAFTTDHILIKEKYLAKAIKALNKLGFSYNGN